MKPRELADRLGIHQHTIYRTFKAKWMSMPMLLKTSEVLQKNLLLEYHPNVAPLLNPLEAENNALKQQLSELQNLAQENTILKAKLEVLEKVLSQR